MNETDRSTFNRFILDASTILSGGKVPEKTEWHGEKGEPLDEFTTRLDPNKTYELGWDHDQDRPFAKEIKL